MSEIGERVLALHADGLKSLDIAYRLGVAQATVHYHLRRLNEQPAADGATSRPGAESRTSTRRAAGSIPTRELVALLLAQGLDRAEVARRLGVAKSTVTYHAGKLGEKIDPRFAKRVDWARVQAYYDEGNSVRGCAQLFGFSTWAWSDAVARGEITPRPAFRPHAEVFAPNTRRNRGHLKTRLLRSGLKDGTCERCGIADWAGQPLSLELHHINGDRLDNRLENLELLCPNCHSQTDTYAGRNGPRRQASGPQANGRPPC